MAIPWLRVLDAAVGITSLVRRVSGRPAAAADPGLGGVSAWGGGQLEARLAGVVVAALKEAFDRDSSRLEIEREQIDAERRRAERALRLELLRQAGDRELGRLRLLAGVALASWLGTLFFAGGLAAGGAGARIALALGWLLLLGALGAAFAGQTRVPRSLNRVADRPDHVADTSDVVSSGTAVTVAPWMILAGLAAVALGVLAR